MITGLKLYRWQEEFVAWYSLRRRQGHHSAYLAADVGTGKTIGALAAARKVGAEDIIVIAPLSAHDSWVSEAPKFGYNLKPGEDIFTYEKFNRMSVIPIGDLLILDEAHRAKNNKAKVTQKLLKHYQNEPKILLSGTPQDRLYELYTQYKLIDPSIWQGWSWSKWVKFYYHLDSYFRPVRLQRDEYRDVILRTIEPHTFRVNIEDVTEMPDLVTLEHKLSKSRQIAKKWREVEADLLNPVTSFISEYAVAQGIDPETKELFDTAKIDWALDYLEDHPQTIVFSYFRTPVVTIRNRYGNRFYYVLGDDKKDLQDAIIKGDRPIIATYSLKEGANLQKYSSIVYLSLPLAYRDYYQSRGRIYRSGQEAKKLVVNKLLRHSIDYEVQRIVDRKMELHEYVRERQHLKEG